MKLKAPKKQQQYTLADLQAMVAQLGGRIYLQIVPAEMVPSDFDSQGVSAESKGAAPTVQPAQIWVIEVKVKGTWKPTPDVVTDKAAGDKLLKAMLANSNADKGTPSDAGSYRVSAYARVETKP